MTLPSSFARSVRTVAALALLATVSRSASAQATLYSSQAALNAAHPVTLRETFSGLSYGVIGNFSRNGVSYSALPAGGPLFIWRFSGDDALVADGNEVFRVDFNGLYDATGFEYVTNGLGPITIDFFNAGGSVGSTTVSGANEFRGFLGASYSGGISGFTWSAVGGQTLDTGLDDLYIGSAVSTVPEPTSVVLVGMGLVGVVVTGRRKRR